MILPLYLITGKTAPGVAVPVLPTTREMWTYTGETPAKALCYEERLRAGTLKPGEGKTHLLYILKCLKCKARRRMDSGSFQWCPVTGSEAVAANSNKRGSEHEETLHCSESNQTLPQVAQRVCGDSLFGYAQKHSGHCPVCTAIGGACLSSRVGSHSPKRSQQTSNIL